MTPLELEEKNWEFLIAYFEGQLKVAKAVQALDKTGLTASTVSWIEAGITCAKLSLAEVSLALSAIANDR